MQTKKKLNVMGESNQPKINRFMRDQGMTLSDVLGESEGVNPLICQPARIFVMRTDLNTKTSTIYHLNLTSLPTLVWPINFKCKNDIVYIDASGTAAGNVSCESNDSFLSALSI